MVPAGKKRPQGEHHPPTHQGTNLANLNFLMADSVCWVFLEVEFWGGLCPFLIFIYIQEIFLVHVSVSLALQSFSLTLTVHKYFHYFNIFIINNEIFLMWRKQEVGKNIYVKFCMNKIQTTLEQDSASS